MSTTPRSRRRTAARDVASAVAMLIVIAGGVVVLLSGWTTKLPSSVRTPPTLRHIAQPAGPYPSASAQMVCASEAQRELTDALGVAATTVTTPTWSDHLYSCRYDYPRGVIAMSVKELSDRAETTTYFEALGRSLGVRKRIKDVAQGAFITRGGAVVLRKDYKVLVVDTSGLRVPFGSGFDTRAQVSVGVAVTVLGCWTGA